MMIKFIVSVFLFSKMILEGGRTMARKTRKHKQYTIEEKNDIIF